MGAVAELLLLLRLLLRGVLLLCAELHTEVRVWGQGGLSNLPRLLSEGSCYVRCVAE